MIKFNDDHVLVALGSSTFSLRFLINYSFCFIGVNDADEVLLTLTKTRALLYCTLLSGSTCRLPEVLPERKRGQSTFTEEEEEFVCTSIRVGAPRLDRRKCRVSLAPRART